MITDYEVVKGRTITELEGCVYQYLQQGWVPQGSVCFAMANRGLWLQAMIRVEDEE